MEIQLTDFENAAFVAFVVLLTRVISAFDINLYIPLSKVDANIAVAHQRNAVVNGKYYFRKELTKGKPTDEVEYELMTINEIINGKESSTSKFTGLVPLIKIFLETINVPTELRVQLCRYLNFISKRASGELVTAATFIRSFVSKHPDYKQDSVISTKINHDLVNLIAQIGLKEVNPPELLGDFTKDCTIH